MVAQNNCECAARHRNDSPDHFDIDQSASSESNEARRVEPCGEIAEPITDRIGFILGGLEMKELALRDDRGELLHRN
jgi:hypothetical protein